MHSANHGAKNTKDKARPLDDFDPGLQLLPDHVDGTATAGHVSAGGGAFHGPAAEATAGRFTVSAEPSEAVDVDPAGGYAAWHEDLIDPPK